MWSETETTQTEEEPCLEYLPASVLDHAKVFVLAQVLDDAGRAVAAGFFFGLCVEGDHAVSYMRRPVLHGNDNTVSNIVGYRDGCGVRRRRRKQMSIGDG